MIVLTFDVVPDAVVEHDDWHTHEHLPERLSIPGFLRGTRWVAPDESPRYFVLYEVEDVATLTSAPYLARLNRPTAWTAKIMPHYRGMTRALCAITATCGAGVGQAALLVRFKPAKARIQHLREWLLTELPRLPSLSGLGSAHLFEAATTPPSTNEQRIRGTDSTFDWAVLVTGYNVEPITDLAQGVLSDEAFERQGATKLVSGVYRMGYSLTHRELRASATDPAGSAATVQRAQSQ